MSEEIKKRANKVVPSGHKWKAKTVTYCANCGERAGSSSDMCSKAAKE